MNKEYILPCTIEENKLLASLLGIRYHSALGKITGAIMDLAKTKPDPKDFIDHTKLKCAYEQLIEWVSELSSVQHGMQQILFKIQGLDGNGLPKNEEAISAESV